jgi:HSP20 family molecular chaperone IbpA
VDLPEFSPHELTVKIVGDVITVYGTHTETSEDGKVSKTHEYVRRFTVPKGLKTDNVEWNLEPNGALAIQAGDGISGAKSQVHIDCTVFKPRSFFKKAVEA